MQTGPSACGCDVHLSFGTYPPINEDQFLWQRLWDSHFTSDTHNIASIYFCSKIRYCIVLAKPRPRIIISGSNRCWWHDWFHDQRHPFCLIMRKRFHGSLIGIKPPWQLILVDRQNAQTQTKQKHGELIDILISQHAVRPRGKIVYRRVKFTSF